MFTLRQLSASLLVLSLALVMASAQTPTNQPEPTSKTSIIIERQAVRFITPGEAVEWRLVITNQRDELVFDSGLVYGSALEWPLKNQQGEASESGLYTYTLTTRAVTEETARTQRGHLMLARPSPTERIWVTNDKGANIGAESPEVKLTVVGSGETTVGGAELPSGLPSRAGAEERTLSERARMQRDAQGHSLAEAAEPVQKQSAGGLTPPVKTNIPDDLLVNGNLTFTPAGARDINMQNNSGGLRFFGAPTLTTSPAAAAIQFWGNNSGFTGQLYLDSGAHNNAALIFRTTGTGGTIAERMRVNANGNVGIGTNAPATPLEVNGLLRSTRNNAPAQYIQLWGGDNSSIRLTGQSIMGAEKGLLIQNLSGEVTPSNFNNIQFQVGTTAAPSTKMIINNNGNVGIGTFDPIALLHAESSSGLGVYALSSTNVGVAGVSDTDTGVWGISSSGSGVYGQSSVANSLAAAGVYGKGFGSGGIGVIGEANTNNAVGVFGVTTSTAGVGVYARNLSGGRAMYAEGNVAQNLANGGLVKALLKVNADGNIARCYNAITNSAAGNCGFGIFHQTISPFSFDINFGFKVDDRFVSVTTDALNVGTNASVIYGFGNENTIRVLTYAPGAYSSGISFTIIVY